MGDNNWITQCYRRVIDSGVYQHADLVDNLIKGRNFHTAFSPQLKLKNSLYDDVNLA